MFADSVERANRKEEVGTQVRKGVTDETKSFKFGWELGGQCRGRGFNLHGVGEGAIFFQVREGSFIQGADIEVLVPDPLGFPCHVEAVCLAKTEGRSRR